MNASERAVTEAIAQQAQAWFITNRENAPSAEQHYEFLAWLQSSPMHVREYLAYAKLGVDLRAVTRNIDAPLEELVAATHSEPDDNVVAFTARVSTEESWTDSRFRPRATGLSRPWTRTLAAVIGVVSVALLGWWMVTQLLLQKSYLTGHGEQRIVLLDDGSVLHINSDSRVRVDYTDTHREIVMEQGQALFRVARDEVRPFRVRAGGMEVVAVGTEFDVRRLRDEVLVTVVEGSVAVLKVVSSKLASTDAAKTPAPLQLAAGQQARVANDLPHTVRRAVDVRAVDVRPAVAWAEQKIMFERETLQNVAAEFNRYGATQLSIEDGQIARLRISGVFNAYDLDSFVLYLQSLKGLKIHRDANWIRISLDRDREAL
jgi:transmembrane sensor